MTTGEGQDDASVVEADVRPQVWTVGHSNIELVALLQLLLGTGVQAVVDVRSDPDKVYRDHFRQQPLRAALEGAGLTYVFLGRELGGRPRDPRHFDDRGHARYDLMADQADFKSAVERVSRGASKLRVVLLCSEEDPADCHRRLLVGRALREGHGVALLHLRGDGRLMTEDQLAEGVGGQPGLFDDLEVRAWRSARSVPPTGAQSRSSSP